MKKLSLTVFLIPSIAFGVSLLLFSSYWLSRFAIAKYVFFRADQAGQKDKMVEMYQLQQSAININPYSASYHRRYAITNLSLATAMANKTDLSPEEKDDISKLIQQAVREAQTATNLAPHQAGNWQILGQTYANLIDITPDASQHAITAYLEAIKLQPTDPELLFNLSKIFYQTDNFPEAQKLLTQTIKLKPDHVNAHYNLANALAKQDKLTAAVVSYENVLSLVEPTSEDYKLAAEELTAIRTKIGQR